MAVKRGEYMEFDLENAALEIMTDSVSGSGHDVDVWFRSSQGSIAGGVELDITLFSIPKYALRGCTGWINLPTDLPSGNHKVFRITKTRTAGTVRVKIECNDKEVLNTVLSNSACADKYSNDWSQWNEEVTQIKFDKGDIASDFYRGIWKGNYVCR